MAKHRADVAKNKPNVAVESSYTEWVLAVRKTVSEPLSAVLNSRNVRVDIEKETHSAKKELSLIKYRDKASDEVMVSVNEEFGASRDERASCGNPKWGPLIVEMFLDEFWKFPEGCVPTDHRRMFTAVYAV